jgi:glycosyltransferase involved in cell wall biosynthesis
LAYPCIESLNAAMLSAKTFGIESELVVVLDRADSATSKAVEDSVHDFAFPIQVIEVDAGDLATARNAGISASRGEYIALTDGDDLYSENWLSVAINQARNAPQIEKTVVHPEIAYFFGEDNRIMWSPDSVDLLALGVDSLLWDNLWISTMLTKRSLLIESPFIRRLPGKYGFEDWSWYQNCETLGVTHRKAWGTMHCVRLKPAKFSLNKDSAASGEVSHPSEFLLEIFNRLKSLKGSAEIGTKFEIHDDTVTRWRKLATFKKASEIPIGQELVTQRGSRYPSWDESTYIQSHQDVKQSLLERKFSSGLSHYVLHGWKEGRQVSMKGDSGANFIDHKVPCPELSSDTFVPIWATRIMDQLSVFEPLLSSKLQKAPWLWNPFREEGIAQRLFGLFNDLNRIDCLVVVPFLGLGGADLAAIEIAVGLNAQGFNVAVLSTAGGISQDRKAVLEECGISRFELDFLPEEDRGAKIFADLIGASNVRWVHVVNSELGWRSLRHLKALKPMAVTVSLFCIDFDPFGRPLGYLSRFSEIRDYVDAIATDNSTMGPFLQEQFGFDSSHVVAIKHRVKKGEMFHGPSKSPKVLWAGRLDRQKNLPKLLSIANALPHLQFDVFGTSVTDADYPVFSDWPPNVVYMGGFTNFAKVPRDYGVFLYTSLWDGLPNVLLEVALSGLPIVAPRVGGIGVDLPQELMFLYNVNATINEVALLVETAISQVQASLDKASKLREFVADKHSDASALESVLQFAITAGVI